MPRNLEKCDNNEFRFLDPRSNEEVIFFYRSPTTEDRVRHQASRYGRIGSKMVIRTRTACVESAAAILTGIRDGDFVVGDEPLSSTPGGPGYREDWRDLIRDMAGDLLLLMGHDLFEQKIGIEVLNKLEIVDEFEGAAAVELEDGELEVPPLAKSSGGSPAPAPRSGKRNAQRGAARR